MITWLQDFMVGSESEHYWWTSCFLSSNNICGLCLKKEAFLQAAELCIIQASLLIGPKIVQLELKFEKENWRCSHVYACLSDCFVWKIRILKACNWDATQPEEHVTTAEKNMHLDWFLPSLEAGTCLPAVEPRDTHSLPVACCAAYTPTLLGPHPWYPHRWPKHTPSQTPPLSA